jgi:uncharacterized protein
MTPREELQDQLTKALKARDTTRVATLRLLLTALTNERIAQGSEVDEAGLMKLVQKAIKQRKEAAEAYAAGGRAEQAAQENAEAEILAEFLPPPVDEAEIRAAIEELVAADSLAGPQAIGRVMKEMVARFSGRADGATISRIAREVLS